MVYTCSVPNCKGNYTSATKVTVFSFPKNEIVRRKWIKAINPNFVPTPSSKVCIRHFTESQIRRTKEICSGGRKILIRLVIPRLRVGAVPSLFDNDVSQSNPETFQKNHSKKKKRIRNDLTDEDDSDELMVNNTELSRNSMVSPDSNETSNMLKTFDDFLHCLVDHKFNDWHVIEKDDIVLFAMISLTNAPTISASAVVNKNLEVRIFKGKSEMKFLNDRELPLKISNIDDFEIILNELSSLELGKVNENISTCISLLQEVGKLDNSVQTKVSFLCEQLDLLLSKKHLSYRYSTDYMVFCCILWLISPHAYQYLRTIKMFGLPFVSTLHKICPKPHVFTNSDEGNTEFLSYLKERTDDLQPKDKVVSLTIDEIQLRPYFNSRIDNDILQKAFNITRRAKTAQVYIINSLYSSFKEIVHILPVKEMDSDTLFSQIKKIILGLHKIGFDVVCVVSNNNPINKGAMANFVSPPATQIVYKHPVDENKPLFYAFDSAYILKNIRNNWANQSDKLFLFPEFGSANDKVFVADFSVLSDVFEVENSKIFNSALNVFDRAVIDVLKEKEEEPHFGTTAKFMEIILKWWSIMSAKVFSENVAEDYRFLENCLVWLDLWARFEMVENRLSDETHEAFAHTIYAFLQLAEYCHSELNLGYVLPSKVRTGFLEARYGRYRTMPVYDTLFESG